MPQSLSSAKSLSGNPIWGHSLCLTNKLSHLSLKTTPIRMGGGPRTYPGGVSKWQWKRMQAKKAKQLLKARLDRERQIYEMRKRAELKAAVSELERPWEAVEKPPNLFSISADDQLKVLADRFQKPGGLDLWSERDGSELFRPDNDFPSSRFFPKGVVHSIQPYRKSGKSDAIEEDLGINEDGVNEGGMEPRVGRSDGENRNMKGKLRKKGNRNMYKSAESERLSFGNSSREFRSSNGVKKGQNVEFDMSLQNDGFEVGELR
ncbi:hypothetical protein SASPL_102039 [Salvia splendens]|uniref:DEAD-box ATP-dependent RNA helicase 33 n=1 Tax=Salvia splendens TaxID=180675 RepID=A0A8X9AE40_SALSN|nr:DEAD-box ATP-dependent RNA helicase 48-like [Salvia splendens]KAG6437129.1 hypothetical protein SASPL_102039 [Salvia splendens]